MILKVNNSCFLLIRSSSKEKPYSFGKKKVSKIFPVQNIYDSITGVRFIIKEYKKKK